MQNKISFILGGSIALILLGLYVFTLGKMGFSVLEHCKGVETCEVDGYVGPSTLFNYIATTIGGLISALVIAHLGASRAGGNGDGLMLLTTEDGKLPRLMTILTIVYLVTWIVMGVFSLYVGALNHPDINPHVTDFGMIWLGLAVSAAYAYFQINQKPSNS